MKKKFIFCFDLDNTICLTKGKNYKSAKPIKIKINFINKLYKDGHIIKIFTSRFMGRNNENVKKARKQGYTFTKKQLNKWGLKHHLLIMGKPSFDYFIDDKSLNFNNNWQKKIRSILKI